MYVYHIYISSHIIMTSPDVIPVSLPGLVLLLVLYPTSCRHTHTHALNEDVFKKHSILIWDYTVHSSCFKYTYIAPRNLTGRVALTSHEDILLLRDFTNVFVFQMCHNMFDAKILTMLPAPPLQICQEFHMLWKFLSLGSRRLIFWTSHQFWRRWWRRLEERSEVNYFLVCVCVCS